MRTIFVVFCTLALQTFSLAQVDRLAILPFEAKAEAEADRELVRQVMNWSFEDWQKLGLYEVLPYSQIREIFPKNKVTLGQINDWSERSRALARLAPDVDYILAGSAMFSPDGLNVALGAQLLRVSDGEILKSGAVNGDRQDSARLTRTLNQRVMPSREDVMKEVESGYRAAWKEKDYGRAAAFASWAMRVDLKSWQAHYNRGRAYEAAGNHSLAEQDYKRAQQLLQIAREALPRELAEALARIGPLRGKLQEERASLIQRISEREKQGEILCRQLDLLLVLAKEFSSLEAHKEKARAAAAEATDVKKDFAEAQSQLPQERLSTAAKESNQILDRLASALDSACERGEKCLENFRRGFAPLADAHFSKGMKFQEQGKLAEAFAEFEKMKLLAPQDARAHYQRGLILERGGNHEQASSEFSRAIELDGNHGEAHYHRAVAFSKTREWKRTAADLRKALELRPNFAEGHFLLAEAQRELGEFDDAMKSYSKALELDDRHEAAYLQRGRLHELRHQLPKAREDYLKAASLGAKGKASAETSLLRVEAYLSKDARIYAERGMYLADSGEFAAALADYDASLEIQPDNAEVRFAKGRVHQMRGEDEQAVREYGKAIERDASNCVYYLNRAICRQRLGLFDDAMQDLESILNRNADFHKAYHRRGSICEQQERFREAILNYEKASQIAKTNPFYHFDLARVYRHMGEVEQANNCLERARNAIK